MRARTYSPKVLRPVNKIGEAKDDVQDDIQRPPNIAAQPLTNHSQLTPDSILHLQTTIGNRAVMRLLAQRSTSHPVSPVTSSIQRKLDLTTKWTGAEKDKYETAFNALEEIIATLKGKPEADFKKFKELVTIFNKYNNRPTPKSPAVLQDLNKIVTDLGYAKGLAAKYVKAVESPKEAVESDEGESESEDYDLLALAKGSTTGKEMAAKEAEKVKAQQLKEQAKKDEEEREAYYASFTRDTARDKLNEWVTNEASRMVKEIQDKFAAAPQTYGSVFYTQPDARLVGIAKLTAAGLYKKIATKIKAEFPDGNASHLKNYFYHHTKSKTKGSGGFNITGWLQPHSIDDKSPFNLHVVHQ
jgi:hypothetical protein